MMVLLHGQWQWLYFVNRLLFLTYKYCLVLLFKKKGATQYTSTGSMYATTILFFMIYWPFFKVFAFILLTARERRHFLPSSHHHTDFTSLHSMMKNYGITTIMLVIALLEYFCNDCLVWFVKVNERSRHWNYLSTLVSVLSVAKLCFRDD